MRPHDHQPFLDVKFRIRFWRDALAREKISSWGYEIHGDTTRDIIHRPHVAHGLRHPRDHLFLREYRSDSTGLPRTLFFHLLQGARGLGSGFALP